MNQVTVKVRRDKIESCMTCSICNKLLKEATTISECLHTFCRKCIFELINEEDLDCCPVCNINLGGAPMDKLRPDHCLQDLQARLFPSKKTKAKATESVSAPSPSAPSPTRKKERSLASLAINTPIVEAQISGSTGKEKKSGARKGLAFREFGFQGEEAVKTYGDHADGSSSFNNVENTAQSIVKDTKQNMSIAKHSSQYAPGRGKNSFEPYRWDANMWEHSKSPKDETSKATHGSVNSIVNFTPPRFQYGEPFTSKAKFKETDENASSDLPQSSVNPKKPRGARRKRVAPAEVQTVDETRRECEQGRAGSIWFSLVASNQQKIFPPLAQIPSRYLMIKDGSMPVSLIKKYLVNKLGLISEDEVEIKLRGYPLPGACQMHELVDMWLYTSPTTQRIQTTVGSSARDVVMVLFYGRMS